jgi:phosphoglycerate dehydrogenase-like enzyme
MRAGKRREEPDAMTMRILWPAMPPEYDEVAREAVGPGIETIFHRSAAEVSDAEWMSADAIVGPYPGAEAVGKWARARIYVKASVGFDEVDIERLGGMGVAVCNTPDYGTREVADHAIALMMTLGKSIAYHNESLREDLRGNWRPAHNPFGRRLSACTFGVIGAGRIGTAAMRRAAAFDMDVVFYDPYVPNGYELALGVRRAGSLAELMAQCDYVSVHAPLNAETRGLVGAEAFAAAKKGLILVNTARGPIVDIDALHDAMKDGKVLAAGLDVLPEEPADAQRRLIKAWQSGEDWIRHRLVLTPHSAFFTPESARDIRFLSARTAARYLRGGRAENCVNAQFLRNPR